LLGIVAMILFVTTLSRAVWYDAVADVPAPPSVAPAVIAQDTPARIIIPALDIDAGVEHVGLATADRMAVPHRFHDAGWYKYGPTPGALGTAVILGHLDNGLGLSGVFKQLHELSPGDEVDVLTAQGKTLRFRVESLKSYPYDHVPADAIASSDAARLVLVTCGGHWIHSANQGMTYDHRVIVETVLENRT